ncbi:MAG: hypothetical protein K0S32_1542 [Bacteroidetes bacterium]|jgi:hypothetical protein|nr:hypothetical protein [Bacteroidota bacterium]
MKFFKNNTNFFLNILYPGIEDQPENVNAFNIYSQEKFNTYIKKLGAEEEGTVSNKEIQIIEKIKSDIENLKNKYKTIDKDRLEFDLALIFHSNLKELNWGRYLLDDYSMWRWLSTNHFLKEVLWRRGEDKKKKGLVIESAKSTFDHLIGKRTRDIFPRRYFLIGERLYDKEKKYELLNKLAVLSRENKTGGFGNLVLNLIDTKLLSPNDNVSKTISQVLFTQNELAEDKEVVRAFTRYNGFKKRLLNNAGKDIFEKEICIG